MTEHQSFQANEAQRDRLYPTYPFLAVSIAVFKQGKALIARRARPPAAGVWSLPGGVVEVGETLAEAARRELWEEVGVQARVIGFNRHVERLERDAQGRVKYHFVVASFIGLWESGTAAPSAEASAIRWIDPDCFAKQTVHQKDDRAEESGVSPLDPVLCDVLQSAHQRLRRLCAEQATGA